MLMLSSKLNIERRMKIVNIEKVYLESAILMILKIKDMINKILI